MLKFYYNPLSPNARRVWLTLLEKEISFESILVNLDGDQLQPDFLTINPFHHIPVVVDDGFRVVESLAILDYLENKFPTPAMLPTEPQNLATVRMVQMVTANELFPQVISLIYDSEDSPQFLQAKQHIDLVLKFFTVALGVSTFFGSEQLTLATISLILRRSQSAIYWVEYSVFCILTSVYSASSSITALRSSISKLRSWSVSISVNHSSPALTTCSASCFLLSIMS